MKWRRLAILLFMCAGALTAVAQEAPQHLQTTQVEPQKAQPAGQGGLGAELAKTSREAAGEEDETTAFKESPSVQWVARHTGLSPRAAYWASIVLNFAIIAVVLVVVLKSNLPNLFRARTSAIQKGIEEARKASDDAQRRLSEIEQRLSKLDVEIGDMRRAAEADAAAEEQRIRAAAEEDKQKIIATAEQEIAVTARAARRELKAYVAELAVGLAERRIRVDSRTDQALVRSFVEQLGEPESNGSGRETS